MRAASSRFKVGRMLLWNVLMGALAASPTMADAARWKIVSIWWRLHNRWTWVKSSISQTSTSGRLSWPSRSAVGIGRLCRTVMVTNAPRRISASVRLLATKPSPPVMSTRLPYQKSFMSASRLLANRRSFAAIGDFLVGSGATLAATFLLVSRKSIIRTQEELVADPRCHVRLQPPRADQTHACRDQGREAGDAVRDRRWATPRERERRAALRGGPGGVRRGRLAVRGRPAVRGDQPGTRPQHRNRDRLGLLAGQRIDVPGGRLHRGPDVLRLLRGTARSLPRHQVRMDDRRRHP